MAAKRSRLCGSSSFGNISVLSGSIIEPEIRCPVSRQPVKSAKNHLPVIGWKISPDHNSPPIFSISVPDNDPFDRELQQFDGFLEKCFYCKKCLGVFEEVFMYSNLRAFCSADCREKQIDMDEDLKKQPATPKVKSGKRRSNE